MNKHTKIVLTIFISTILFMCLSMNCYEKFYVNVFIKKSNRSQNKKQNLFNIDEYIKIKNQPIGWKTFWRKNYSSFDNNLNNVFREPEYTPFKNKLMYDTVKHLKPPF